MSDIKELFHSKWLAVQEKTLENGVKYIYSTAPWCNSAGVAILPFRRVVVNSWGFKELQFLGRFEVCPAHSDEAELGAIMGGMDKIDEPPAITAWRELIEEGGYEVPVENIVPLGTSKPSKASDNIMYLFAVDMDNGCKEVEAIGDGTALEELGYCEWISFEQLMHSKEPLMQTMYLRLTRDLMQR